MPTNVKVDCSRCPASSHGIVEQDPAQAAFADICRAHDLHTSLEAQSCVLCKCRACSLSKCLSMYSKAQAHDTEELYQGLTMVLGPVRPEVPASLAARRRCSRDSCTLR